MADLRGGAMQTGDAGAEAQRNPAQVSSKTKELLQQARASEYAHQSEIDEASLRVSALRQQSSSLQQQLQSSLHRTPRDRIGSDHALETAPRTNLRATIVMMKDPCIDSTVHDCPIMHL